MAVADAKKVGTTKSKTARNRCTAKKQVTAKKQAAAKKPSRAKSATLSKQLDATVTVDRRTSKDCRKATDRRKKAAPVTVERRKIERRAKVNRRRQIDPTTCERDYSSAEIEFMSALDKYKRTSGRMFPTCSEILEVLQELGYRKLPAGESDDLTGQVQEEQEAAV
ncbi:MAG: hypothetical protein ABIP48_21935 [Planctomycetota bacterium]